MKRFREKIFRPKKKKKKKKSAPSDLQTRKATIEKPRETGSIKGPSSAVSFFS